MGGAQVISSIDVHAEGEPGRVLLGANLRVRGDTMAERLQWCTEHLDDLRYLLLREPRGHPAMCAALILPPVSPNADVALIILEHGGFRPMSGSNTICAVTALLETGALPLRAPQTTVRIDTAAGPIEAIATVSAGKVETVQVHNVPSWAVALDTAIHVPEYGTVPADIAFGGQYYVQAAAAAVGIELQPANAPAIVRAGMALLAAARSQVTVSHPTDANLSQIALVMLHGPADTAGISARNSVVLPNGPLDPHSPETWRGSLDRSPCGTGTCARMACLHARGQLELGVPFIHQGILGTTFEGLLHQELRVGERDAVLPSIKARAWITGINQHILHPGDPFPRGYTVPDLWADSST